MTIALRTSVAGLTLAAAALAGMPTGSLAAPVTSDQVQATAPRNDDVSAVVSEPSGSRAVTLRFGSDRVRTTPAQRRTISRTVAVSPESVDSRVTITPIVRPNATKPQVRIARARASAVARDVRRAPAFDRRTEVRIQAPARVRGAAPGRVRIVVTWGSAIPVLLPPTEVTATAGVRAISVQWQAPRVTVAPTSYVAYAIAGSRPSVDDEPSESTPSCTSRTATACTIAGLVPGRAYWIAVTARYDFERSPLAFADATVTPASDSSPEIGTTPATLELPGPPGTPSAVASDREAQISWSAPTTGGGSITGYRVTVSTSPTGTFTDAGGTCSPETTTTSTALTCTASGLTNGVAHYFRVAAVNPAGTGTASAPSAAATPAGVPGTPAAPGATAGDTTSVLTWTAPSDGGTAITGYAVQRSLFGGAFTTQPGCTSLGVVLTCTATGLNNGTSVRFRVAAINAAGQGPWSAASSSITPFGVPGTPDRPTALAGELSVTVEWAPPSSNGSRITSYTVSQATASTGPYVNVTSACQESGLFPDVTQCTLTGLTAGTEYFYTVTATNARGAGDPSAASIGVKPVAPSTAPVITSVDEGNTQLTVRYTVTASGGERVWSRYSSDDGGAWTAWVDSGSTAGSVTITGLTNGTFYEVQLGLAVPPATPTTLVSGTATGRPRTTPGTPTGFTATAHDGYASLNWTAPSDGGAPILGYTVNVGTSATGPWRSPEGTCASSVMSASTRTTCNATGLTNGTTYFFQVAALNEAGVGAFATSSSVVPIGPPDTPAPPTANGDETTITVRWTAPATNGSAITGYEVLRATSELGPFAAITAGTCRGALVNVSTAVSCIDNDSLSTSATYYYKVAARSAAGTSEESEASDGTTLVPAAEAPDITGITAGDRQVSVAFTYGSAASNVQFSLDGGSTWYSRFPLSASSPLAITGLANGTTYRIRLRMVISSGFSDPSDIVPAIPRTTPAAPEAPVGTAKSASVDLTWSAPADDGGAPISGYTVQASANGSAYADQAGCTNLGVDFSCTATGLTPGTAYTFKVAAINAAGTGAYSAASSAITPLAASCAAGGSCSIGDTGPGGGIVFYVGDFPLTSTGAQMKYLEAAPSTWSGSSDPSSAWSGNTTASVTTQTAIGTGAKNSSEMLATNPTGAAQLATAYRGNGFSDWYLPSTEELRALAQQRGRFPAGSFQVGGYWTSSQTADKRASIIFISDASSLSRSKALSNPVRPIRAFAPAG